MKWFGIEFLFLLMVLLNDANDGACDDIIFLPYQFVDSLFDPGVDEFDIYLSMENQLPW